MLFLERFYSVVSLSGETIDTIQVKIYKPISLTESEWKCSYSIQNIGNDKQFSIIGIDSIQAIILAMHQIKTKLEVYNQEHQNQIVWNSKSNDFGLSFNQ